MEPEVSSKAQASPFLKLVSTGLEVLPKDFSDLEVQDQKLIIKLVCSSFCISALLVFVEAHQDFFLNVGMLNFALLFLL